MTTVTPHFTIHDETRLRANEIARSRNYNPDKDPRPLLSITTAKLYKDVRLGILKKPEKIGGASLWRWGDIRRAYGLAPAERG